MQWMPDASWDHQNKAPMVRISSKALPLSMEKIIMGVHSNNVASIIGIFFLTANWFLMCIYMSV
jgi:hypothetical protein